jgi:hypothetical protein
MAEETVVNNMDPEFVIADTTRVDWVDGDDDCCPDCLDEKICGKVLEAESAEAGEEVLDHCDCICERAKERREKTGKASYMTESIEEPEESEE